MWAYKGGFSVVVRLGITGPGTEVRIWLGLLSASAAFLGKDSQRLLLSWVAMDASDPRERLLSLNHGNSESHASPPA